ncbi:fibroin p25 domain-containing protein [Phthorimaea operculella]|nr:fibroin p25 domain-containing protein [Phthorimaea operculella]
MKNYVCLVIWLVSFGCSVYGQRVGNPDDTAKIERPCPTFDMNCIRNFFEKHAHCKKMFGPAPDPLYRPQSTVFISRVNLTVTSNDVKIGGTNGRVEEFYINRDTDKLVIAVEFRNNTQSTNSSYFRFHRRAKEPVVTLASASVSYQSFITTAVIPKIDNLQLKRAECTTFVNDNNNNMVISPSAFESSDPQVQQTGVELYQDVPTTIQEIFLTDSSFFITMYIQYNICDFADEAENIVRPCPVYDLNCIRKYFSEHAHCHKVFGPAPEPLIRPQLTYYFPRTNMTVTIVRNMILGINGRVEEFYINKKTNNLVLAVHFQNLNLTTEQGFFKFHRNLKEPVVTTAPASVTYQSVVITAVIHDLDDLQLETAECTTYANDPGTTTMVGPSAAVSSDPQVQAQVAEFMSNLAVNTRELFLTDSFYYISAFIQYNICDFGLILT